MKTSKNRTSSIVEGGYDNLVEGLKREARQEVNAKYADEWKDAGWWRRWQLRAQINAEVRELVEQRMPDVSDEAMF